MINFVHLLLTLMASLTRQELAQQARFLKAENKILCPKLSADWIGKKVQGSAKSISG